VRLLLADTPKELFLRERGDTVVAQDVVLVAGQGGELLVDPGEVLLLSLHRIGGVN
jgi:hypothetical protein